MGLNQIKLIIRRQTKWTHSIYMIILSQKGCQARENSKLIESNRSIIGDFLITIPNVGINLIKKLQMYFSYNCTNMSILYFDLKRIELNTEVPGLVNTSWRLVTGIWLNSNLCELVKTTVRLVISLLNWIQEILTF